MTTLRRTLLTEEELSALSDDLMHNFDIPVWAVSDLVSLVIKALPALRLGGLMDVQNIVAAPKSTVRQWALDKHNGFPTPVVDSVTARLWDLDAVRDWWQTFTPPGHGFRSDLRRKAQ